MNIYTVREVSQRLAVHESTVRTWLKAGRLKAIKTLGPRSTRITEQAIEDMLNASDAPQPA